MFFKKYQNCISLKGECNKYYNCIHPSYLNFLKNKQMQVNKLEIEQNYPELILYSWTVLQLLDQNLTFQNSPKVQFNANQPPLTHNLKGTNEECGNWLVLTYFLSTNHSTQFSEKFALILFPCFGMEYFLLFALITKNCIAPSQSDSINFFMYIIDNQISYWLPQGKYVR